MAVLLLRSCHFYWIVSFLVTCLISLIRRREAQLLCAILSQEFPLPPSSILSLFPGLLRTVVMATGNAPEQPVGPCAFTLLYLAD